MTVTAKTPKSYPVEQTTAMRAELDQLMLTWQERGWSLEASAGTVLGYGLHLMKEGRWQTVDELIHTIRSAWPLMRVPQQA
jgi:hypothetical protein